MKSIRKEILVWIQLVTFCDNLGFSIIFSKTDLKIGWEAIKICGRSNNLCFCLFSIYKMGLEY